MDAIEKNCKYKKQIGKIKTAHRTSPWNCHIVNSALSSVVVLLSQVRCYLLLLLLLLFRIFLIWTPYLSVLTGITFHFTHLLKNIEFPAEKLSVFRLIHLDLKGAPPKISYIERVRSAMLSFQ